MTAIGYARRSKESSARTISLEDQRERIAAYCTDHGWTLAETVVDDGVSGGKRARLARLETAARLHHARVVVVYHLDRFARDVAALLDTLHAYTKRGVELHVVGRGRIEADTASGFLVTGVEGLMAEHYRRLIGEKTRDALARLRAMGRRVSRWAPYGHRFAPDGALVPEPAEQAALVAIVALRAAGLSLRAISGELATRGILARGGRPLAPKVIASLVTNRGVGDSR